MITASQALQQLKSRQMVRVGPACQYLADALGCTGIFRLYQQLFPRDYAQSKTPLLLKDVTRYAEREIEFFRLIGERRFPLDEDMLEEWAEEEREQWIPFMPMGCQYTEDDLDDAPLPVQVFLCLDRGYKFSASILEALGPHAPQVQDYDYETQQIYWRRFRRLCGQAGGVLVNAPTAVEVVTNNTGNLWLDVTYETLDGVGPLEWNMETITYLTRQWRRANQLLSIAADTLEQLEGDPPSLVHIIQFWNQSIGKRRKRHGR